MRRDLRSEVAFLSGLVEGSGGHALEGHNDKVLSGVIQVLERLTEDLRDLGRRQEELEAYVTCIDEDLADLEELVLEEEDDDVEEDFVEVDCPDCGETVYFDEEIFDEDAPLELLCPNCGSVVYEELEGEVEVVDRGGRRRRGDDLTAPPIAPRDERAEAGERAPH